MEPARRALPHAHTHHGGAGVVRRGVGWVWVGVGGVRTLLGPKRMSSTDLHSKNCLLRGRAERRSRSVSTGVWMAWPPTWTSMGAIMDVRGVGTEENTSPGREHRVVSQEGAIFGWCGSSDCQSPNRLVVSPKRKLNLRQGPKSANLQIEMSFRRKVNSSRRSPRGPCRPPRPSPRAS